MSGWKLAYPMRTYRPVLRPELDYGRGANFTNERPSLFLKSKRKDGIASSDADLLRASAQIRYRGSPAARSDVHVPDLFTGVGV